MPMQPHADDAPHAQPMIRYAGARRSLRVASVLGGVLVALYGAAPAADAPDLTDFARCLSNKGAVMYGASWCPHCKAQLKQFGNAASELQYVECSEIGIQNGDCNEAGITSYPTWEFDDGSRLTGNLSLDRLSQKTGCQLPAKDKGKSSRQAAKHHRQEQVQEAPPDAGRLPARRLERGL